MALEETNPAPAGPAKVRSQEGQVDEAPLIATVGLVFGVLGATALAFGLIIYALDPSVLIITLANLVFALAGGVFYGLTNRQALLRILTGRSTTLGIFEILAFSGLFLALGTLNSFASQSTTEWDLTRDRLFTLHDQSQKVAAGLSSPVQVIGFYRPNEAHRRQLELLVELYRRHTPNLSVEVINPDTAPPAVFARYKMTDTSPRIVVFASDEKQTKIERPVEQDLTNALIRVLDRPAKMVHYLTGHGEPDLDDKKGDSAVGQSSQILVDDGYQVQKLSLVERDAVPAETNVLVIAAPQSELFKNESNAILSWLLLGGRVLLLLDPGNNTGLDEVFRRFGVDLGDNLVVETNPAAKARDYGPDAPVITSYEQHAITNPLRGMATLFYWARSVSPVSGILDVTSTTLIRTSADSWGETRWRQAAEASRDEADLIGPVPLALAIQKNTSAAPNKVTDEARLVIIGDANFATNRFSSVRGNSQLLSNSVGWLAGHDAGITIRPPRRGGTRWNPTEREQFGIVFFSVNLLPLLIVGVGFSVWAVRRRK